MVARAISRIAVRAFRATHARRLRLSPHHELPLHHSFAPRRVTTFGTAIAVACALACYQEKPPQRAKGAQVTSSSTSGDSDTKLGLQPIPATHDTAIREIDQYQLTTQRLQQWTVAKHALDSLHTTHPEVEAHIRAGERPKTVDEAGKRFDAEPAMHAALQRAGMSGKDFLLTSIALQQAMRGYQLKSLGKLDASKVPPVVLGNIVFVAAHMPELMASMAGGAPRTRRTP